ncbi:MAG TPA: hypothetical protein VNQ31_08070 [Sphingomonadaceae bacterium]|nr:hypothetical protein [Sphingomonadaceae bacterium]
MTLATKYRALGRMPAVRTCLLVMGWLLIAASPAVGILPGPGGIFVFAAGLGLVLRNSLWAKRRYVAFKRRWPRHGALADKGLRRAARRRARRRAAPPDRCDGPPLPD